MQEQRKHVGQFCLLLTHHSLRMPLGGENGLSFMFHGFDDTFLSGDGSYKPRGASSNGLVMIGICGKILTEKTAEETTFLCGYGMIYRFLLINLLMHRESYYFLGNILDQAATINMALSRNACVMPRALSEIISKYWIFPNPFDKEPFDAAAEQKKADFKKAGIEYTIRQIDEYRACGINGIHLYALNKFDDVAYIAKEAGLLDLI